MNGNVLSQLERKLPELQIRSDEPMNIHTTFRSGGNAQFYLSVSEEEQLVKAVKAAWTLDIPVFVFGGGTNMLVSSKGIPGLVIKNNCRSFSVLNTVGKMKNVDGEWKMNREAAIVVAAGGVLMNQLVRFTIEEELAGLEDQLGLPGTVGGAVVVNAACSERSTFVGDVVHKARILTKEGEIKEVDRSYFRYSFDKSYIQQTGDIILSVYFLLTPGDKKVLWQKATEALTYRTSKMPKGNAHGCTYRNMSTMQQNSIATPATIPSQAELIGKAGLDGTRVGDAMVSALNPNFILNVGQSTAEDANKLCLLVKKQIQDKLGVEVWLKGNVVGQTN